MHGDDRPGPGDLDECGPDGFRRGVVQLVGDDATDVVCLEDLRVVGHYGLPPQRAGEPGATVRRAERRPSLPATAAAGPARRAGNAGP